MFLWHPHHYLIEDCAVASNQLLLLSLLSLLLQSLHASNVCEISALLILCVEMWRIDDVCMQCLEAVACGYHIFYLYVGLHGTCPNCISSQHNCWHIIFNTKMITIYSQPTIRILLPIACRPIAMFLYILDGTRANEWCYRWNK